jgi:hypothetical protein
MVALVFSDVHQCNVYNLTIVLVDVKRAIFSGIVSIGDPTDAHMGVRGLRWVTVGMKYRTAKANFPKINWFIKMQ